MCTMASSASLGTSLITNMVETLSSAHPARYECSNGKPMTAEILQLKQSGEFPLSRENDFCSRLLSHSWIGRPTVKARSSHPLPGRPRAVLRTVPGSECRVGWEQVSKAETRELINDATCRAAAGKSKEAFEKATPSTPPQVLHTRAQKTADLPEGDLSHCEGESCGSSDLLDMTAGQGLLPWFAQVISIFWQCGTGAPTFGSFHTLAPPASEPPGPGMNNSEGYEADRLGSENKAATGQLSRSGSSMQNKPPTRKHSFGRMLPGVQARHSASKIAPPRRHYGISVPPPSHVNVSATFGSQGLPFSQKENPVKNVGPSHDMPGKTRHRVVNKDAFDFAKLMSSSSRVVKREKLLKEYGERGASRAKVVTTRKEAGGSKERLLVEVKRVNPDLTWRCSLRQHNPIWERRAMERPEPIKVDAVAVPAYQRPRVTSSSCSNVLSMVKDSANEFRVRPEPGCFGH